MIGALLGVALITLITLVISITVGDGNFYPVVPELTEVCGNELNAMAVQTLCSLLYGAAWGGASLIWAKESWSLLRQTVTHLAVCSLATFPIAYLTRWMAHSAAGILLYFGTFFGVYAAVWLFQYIVIRKRIIQMNQKIQDKKMFKRLCYNKFHAAKKAGETLPFAKNFKLKLPRDYTF